MHTASQHESRGNYVWSVRINHIVFMQFLIYSLLHVWTLFHTIGKGLPTPLQVPLLAINNYVWKRVMTRSGFITGVYLYVMENRDLYGMNK